MPELRIPHEVYIPLWLRFVTPKGPSELSHRFVRTDGQTSYTTVCGIDTRAQGAHSLVHELDASGRNCMTCEVLESVFEARARLDVATRWFNSEKCAVCFLENPDAHQTPTKPEVL